MAHSELLCAYQHELNLEVAMLVHYRNLIAVALLASSTVPAVAQTKTPNATASQALRSWPQTGGWQTVLLRREDQTLTCAMLSARQEAGRIQYVAGIRQRPNDLALVVGDRDPGGVSGDHIRLTIDGVEVGSYEVTQRIDNKSELHSVAALVPQSDKQRIINLLRAGAEAKFTTDTSTFSFPLSGASGSIETMRECVLEAANLAPPAKQ